MLPPIELRELLGENPDWSHSYDYLTSVMPVALSGLAAKTDLPVLG